MQENNTEFSPVCFWCGKEKTENKTAKKVLADYMPCDKCNAIFKKSDSALIAKVSKRPAFENQPFITKDEEGTPFYPTGDLVGANPKLFPGAVVNEIMCMQEELFDKLFKKSIEDFEKNNSQELKTDDN